MRVTMLGCGGSGGVPTVGPRWGRCDPAEPRNRRLRSSILVEDGGTRILVDTSPDLRQQLLAADVARLDAVLWTHAHADHVNGIDDLRWVNVATGQPLDVHGSAATLAHVRRAFGYAFEPLEPGAGRYYKPVLVPHEITGPFRIGDIAVLPIEQDHGFTTSLGFRFGRFAYSTDVVRLSDAAFDQLAGIEVWIVDCLRERPHSTHADLGTVLAWIARVRPARAILTHMGEDLDYQYLRQLLPAGVEPGHDGLTVTL